MHLQWINSAGGPLVCAGPTVGRAWRGDQGSSIGKLQSDYQRACDETDYISVVACGSFQVLILGDEPLQSTFVVKDDGVLVVRWVSCVTSECAASAVAQLPTKLPAIQEPIKFRLNERGLIMFDSAQDKVPPAACARVDMEPGVLIVTSEKYKSEGIYEFLVHRFLRDQDR